MTIPPTVISMLVCDHIHRDGITGKFFLLGTFTTLVPQEYPATIGQIGVFVILTDGIADVAVRLQVVDATEIDPDPLAVLDDTVTFADRFDAVELAQMFIDVTFPQPGQYRVQLLANGSLLMERRIVLDAPPASETP
jgi:hypothetical protein